MEYVVSLLKIVFNKSEEDAVNIMLMVHKKGSGVCGIYTKEIAETKFLQSKRWQRTISIPQMHYGARRMISDEFEKTLQKTKNIAESFNHEYMTIEHLLCAMLDDSDVKKVLLACSIDDKALRNELEIFIKNNLKELSATNEDEIKPTLDFRELSKEQLFMFSPQEMRKQMELMF